MAQMARGLFVKGTVELMEFDITGEQCFDEREEAAEGLLYPSAEVH